MAYLSQLVDFTKFSNSHINLISSPCGSGKTQLAVNYLKHFGRNSLGLSLYVIDVNNNKHHFLEQYPSMFREYSATWMGQLLNQNEEWINFGDIDPLGLVGDFSKAIIINYAQLGGILQHYPGFYKMLSCVVLDEPHHFYKFNGRYINKPLSHSNLIHLALHEMGRLKSLMVLAITATPGRLWKYMSNEILQPVKFDSTNLTTYSTSPISFTTSNSNFISKLKLNKQLNLPFHTLAYFPFIRSMEKFQRELSENGFKAVCLWSKANPNHPYSPIQEEVWDYLLKFQKLPSWVDVLIINSAFETGMNLNDKRFKVFYGSGEVDSLVQSRGRLRHNVEETWIKAKEEKWIGLEQELEWGTTISQINLAKVDLTNQFDLTKFLGIPLGEIEKNQIVELWNLEFRVKNKLKWQGVKGELVGMGFGIETKTKKTNGKRTKYDILTKVLK